MSDTNNCGWMEGWRTFLLYCNVFDYCFYLFAHLKKMQLSTLQPGTFLERLGSGVNLCVCEICSDNALSSADVWPAVK